MPKGIGYPGKVGTKSIRGRVQATSAARQKAIKTITPNMLKRLGTKKR